MSMQRAFVLLVVSLSTACYRYVPIANTSASLAGTQVRVELSDVGTVAVKPAIGEGVLQIEARVIDRGSDQVTLSVLGIRRRGDALFKQWTGDQLSLTTTDIRNLTTRHLDRRRSAMAGIGAFVTAALAAFVISKVSTSSSGGTPTKPPPV
jgi:hypothetical protein